MTYPAGTTEAVTTAAEHAARSWQLFTREKGYTATVTDWRTEHTPDGTPLLSARVTGRGAGYALGRFARDFYVVLQPGDVRPQFDISQPGRTVLVWRYGGVWVELWHPETVDAVVEPVPAAPAPPVVVSAPVASSAARRLFLLRRPSGRLPFTRKSRTTSPKETTSR